MELKGIEELCIGKTAKEVILFLKSFGWKIECMDKSPAFQIYGLRFKKENGCVYQIPCEYIDVVFLYENSKWTLQRFDIAVNDEKSAVSLKKRLFCYIFLSPVKTDNVSCLYVNDFVRFSILPIDEKNILRLSLNPNSIKNADDKYFSIDNLCVDENSYAHCFSEDKALLFDELSEVMPKQFFLNFIKDNDIESIIYDTDIDVAYNFYVMIAFFFTGSIKEATLTKESIIDCFKSDEKEYIKKIITELAKKGEEYFLNQREKFPMMFMHDIF